MSDPYLSFAAGMAGLAGPLHGLANQEVLVWIMKLQEEVGKNVTEDQLKAFIHKTLKSGQVSCLNLKEKRIIRIKIVAFS